MTTPEEAVRGAREQIWLRTPEWVASDSSVDAIAHHLDFTVALDALLTAERARMAARVSEIRMEHTHSCNESHRRATTPHTPYDYERECLCEADVNNRAIARALALLREGA